MRKYYSIPLLFLFLAAMIGLFLRWQFISPTPGVRYTFFLHAHSHVLFLGWIFNVLYLSFVEYYLPEPRRKNYIRLFVALQILVIAMMISFPIQGYGAFSIIFSTLHTLGVMIFIPVFFYDTRKQSSVSLWFTRTSLVFFFLSTAGPFSLGYLMANDLGQTVWYNFSIYYYLHFQYNGFFFFGVLSLFFQLLERKGIIFNRKASGSFGLWMALACVPAYTLSVLFAKPGIAFNLIGAGAATVQIIALVRFIPELIRLAPSLSRDFHPLSQRLLVLITSALILKLILQAASAHPAIAQLAYELRPLVIAYLHLVLVGIITFSLVAWYLEMTFLKSSVTGISISLLVTGFIGSELCLVISPWWIQLVGPILPAPICIFGFSVLMIAGTTSLVLAYRRPQPAPLIPEGDKSHISG